MKKIKEIIHLIKNRKYKVEVERLDTRVDDNVYNKSIKKVINLLNYTKKSMVSYSAIEFHSGYHSLQIGGYTFTGQRNPRMRFKNLPFSLKGLSILDIGCNQGGMLYSFSDEIKHGVGIDYDSRMINVANKIKAYTKTQNIDYYVFDLEKENLCYINDFLPKNKVDVVFLLSVCMWIDNWKVVIDFSEKVSSNLIFETNGKLDQQEEQVEYLKKVYRNVQIIQESSDDDKRQKNRKLYYCFQY